MVERVAEIRPRVEIEDLAGPPLAAWQAPSGPCGPPRDAPDFLETARRRARKSRSRTFVRGSVFLRPDRAPGHALELRHCAVVEPEAFSRDVFGILEDLRAIRARWLSIRRPMNARSKPLAMAGARVRVPSCHHCRSLAHHSDFRYHGDIMAQSNAEPPAARLRLGVSAAVSSRRSRWRGALVQIERKHRKLGEPPQGLAQVARELLTPSLDLGVADLIDVGMGVTEKDIMLKRRTDEGHFCSIISLRGFS